MSDLVINVKQISNYPNRAQSDGTETLLVQTNGLGGPYQAITSEVLVSTALTSASMSVGYPLPSQSTEGNVFTRNLCVPAVGGVYWNAYGEYGSPTGEVFWNQGPAASFNYDPGGFIWLNYGSGYPNQPLPAVGAQMKLDNAGALTLNFGTLTVARDPSALMEVATLNWVTKNTVTSFNNRLGPVILNAADIYNALQYTSPITTEAWVTGSINQAIGAFAANYPIVNSWNGRLGDVYLMLSDITCVFFQSGQQPISPTPPSTSNDDSIATTAWVTTYITNELEGSGGTLASQSWVLANTVNSFNSRQGPVTLTAADVFDLGAAPLNSPNFSGIPAAPTANPGTSTAQLATTAFVQAAIAGSVAGVASFNTRTGAVTLTQADVTGVGGLANPNANLTGIPTAPTATAGTSTTQLATTAFVANAITAGAVSSFNTRTGAVSLLLTDVTGVGGAALASPAFTGTPSAPTASPGTSTTQLATTQFVTQALTAAGGVSSFNSRTGAVTLTNNDITAAGGLTNPNAQLTGIPLAPTATPGTATTQIATTGFVQAAISNAVTSFNSRTGAITLTTSDITGAGGAPINNAALTGTPTAPTATAGTNNTQLATTAFVINALATSTAGVTSFNTRTGAVTLNTADITGAGGAPLNNANLTGIPTAPTATPGTATTQLATTAFVTNAVSTSGVTSFNTRTGAVTLLSNDISAASGALIASPAFTGSPTAPTPTPATDASTNIATTQFVAPAFNATGRNRLHNVGFSINQRSYTTGTALAANAYGHDRWKAGASGCTYTFTASPPLTTITITAGSLTQIIEGASVEGGTYTLSWTGTAQGRINAGSYAASPVTVTGLAANTAITVEFNAGTLARAQLEAGSVATLFDKGGSPQQLLSACQRYYQAGNVSVYGYNGAGNQFSQSLMFPTTMRASPALAITPTTQTNCASTGLGALLGSGAGIGMVVNTTVTALGAFALVGNWTASADL